MKVWVTIERYETRDNYYGELVYNIYDTKEKAIARLNDALKWALVDYEIDRDNELLDITEESANYCSGDWENFDIYIEERKVQ